MKAEWTNTDSLTFGERTKAVLVIDMPIDCAECLFCGWGGRNLDKYVCSLTKEHSEEPHLVGCPLKLMPQKKSHIECSWNAEKIKTTNDFEDGWNACIEEITGETE